MFDGLDTYKEFKGWTEDLSFFGTNGSWDQRVFEDFIDISNENEIDVFRDIFRDID